ncbi:MAG: flagellar hook-basal body complex protein FliE [Gammaproteobacteria bacterium]
MIDNGIDSVLSQMRTMLAEGRVELPAQQLPSTPEAAPRAGFGTLLTDSINKVNEAQKAAGDLQDRFLQGDESVTLAQAMVAGQKSEISFQTLLQVRNRVVSAYEEIMRMPI